MADAGKTVRSWIYRIHGCVSEREVATDGNPEEGADAKTGFWSRAIGVVIEIDQPISAGCKQWVSGCVIWYIIQDSMLRFGKFLLVAVIGVWLLQGGEVSGC